MIVDLDELRSRSKYITEQKHPALPLIIWNYTHTCQFDRAWDMYTRACRGLITDLEGHIIARPFNKFFNLNEHEETKIENLPLTDLVIYEKLDGSLGIQYYWDDEVCIATRGSFSSDQATWATEWLRAKGFKKKDFNPAWTYLYEIIYPENRIVVNYGDRNELVLIAVIETATGKDVDQWQAEALKLGLSCAKQFAGDIWQMMEHLKTVGDAEEGFVIRVEKPKYIRIKVKGEEYVRLHRLITGFSTKSLWECLMNNQDLQEVLERVPDEFYAWVKQKEGELRSNYQQFEKLAKTLYNEVKDLLDRKSQAVRVTQAPPPVSSAVFAMLDHKPYEKIIWKALKPKYELPFKKDIDA